MEIIGEIPAMRRCVAAARQQGRRIGCVPTMGALHAGHLSLVEECRKHVDEVVLTIFVNPTQFAPHEDLAKYPRPLEADLAACRAAGVAAVFLPTQELMYPPGYETWVEVDAISRQLEGEFRPGHFRGVATIVAKLFNIVQPDVACFGRKDIQQVVLIRRMVEELDIPVRLVVVPTVRDPDGLALSSRNAYLSPDERAVALGLPRALRAVVEAWQGGEHRAAALHAVADEVLHREPGIVTDYIAVVHPDRLEPATTAEPGTVIALAARVGSTRLIDNTILGEQDF